MAHIAVHVQDTAGNAVQGVDVTVLGQGWNGITDGDGNYDFGYRPPDTYTVQGIKQNYTPSPQSDTKFAPAGTTTGFVLVLEPARVTQITAMIPGAKGVRDPNNKLPDQVLTPSGSPDESLAGNKPVCLVRGCTSVELTAVTTPPNRPVTWTVKANQNKEAPPAWSNMGVNKIKLATGKTGSFSVIATLNTSKVVWNVVFVWVKVDVKSSSTVGRKMFADQNSTKKQTNFVSSPFFQRGKTAWGALVNVALIGGGSTNQLGIDKIQLQILQNGVEDTLTGDYGAGNTGREVPGGGLPILDANYSPGGPPDPRVPNLADGGTISPFVFDPGSFSVSPNNTAANRAVWTGDSPGGGFMHFFRGDPTKPELATISGANGFKTAIASFSLDAKNVVVVHAQVLWKADFTGKVIYVPAGGGPAAVGHYNPTTATITTDKKYELVSPATGGQDAKDAGFELFEPRFNASCTTKWTP